MTNTTKTRSERCPSCNTEVGTWDGFGHFMSHRAQAEADAKRSPRATSEEEKSKRAAEEADHAARHLDPEDILAGHELRAAVRKLVDAAIASAGGDRSTSRGLWTLKLAVEVERLLDGTKG